MVSNIEKNIILKQAEKYGVSDIYLFGSSAEINSDYHDIDLGVKGLRPGLFFKFYADLFKSLSKPVDLIDMSKKSLFTLLIEKEGIKIYGKPA
jgi:predicted nucleotidyltransferase